MWQKIKAVIFDLDGVLIDSEPLWTESLVHFLARRGIKIDTEAEEYKEIKGRLMGCRQAESITFFKKLFGLKGRVGDIIKFVLNKFNLKKYFRACLLAEEITNGKPAPDIFLKVAKKLNAEPKQCLVFEDSPRGIEAAKCAGMKI